MNDFPAKITNSLSLLYADDCKLVKEIASLSDALKLQTDFLNLEKWSVNNCIPLNKEKCKVLRISRSRNSVIFNYFLHNTDIEDVNSFKDYAISKAKKSLGWLKRKTSKFSNIRTLTIFYFL